MRISNGLMLAVVWSVLLRAGVAVAGTPSCGSPEAPLDGGYDGTLDEAACCQIFVAGELPFLQDVNVNVAVSHTRVGDLTIKLESPAGTLATLMSRPGLVEAADDGSGCCGSTSAWNGALVTFDDEGGGVSAELLGQRGLAVCSGDGVCNHVSAPGSASGNGLIDFIGEDPNGTWFCCVGDSAPGEVGNMEDCVLELVSQASTSTTAPASTATTTTLPSGCAGMPIGATFGSLDCRLAALIAAVQGETRLGTLREKLGGAAQKAKQLEEAAQAACARGTAKTSGKQLKKVMRKLIQFSHRLRSRSARRKVDETVREALAAAADEIQQDARELKGALSCG